VLKEQELLAQIVEVSGDAIFTEDLNGKITTWNRAAERLYGCDAAQMLGRSTADLLPETTAGQLRDVHEIALSGKRVDRFDTLHQRVDGTDVAVSLTVSPLKGRSGQIAGLATSVQDVSDRVRLTTELAHVHTKLERQHRDLARSNRDLQQFAYVASHDLSEPLRYGEVLDERGLRYLRHVVDGATRMRTQIDDLLQYAQFLSAATSSGHVDTTAVARRVVTTLGDVPVEVGELPAVWSDNDSVRAALQNLISNALKFSSPDTPVRVLVSGSVQDGRVHLLVDDNGIGIEPQYRERIFNMFSRLHVREAYAGTGIGLAIVQQIAERCDGRAWVEVSPLGGSRFGISLPASPQLEEAA
jgi:PAS domain S-box-containing protein